MGSTSRREDANPGNWQSLQEMDQLATQPPITNILTVPQERPLATAPASVDLSNTS